MNNTRKQVFGTPILALAAVLALAATGFAPAPAESLGVESGSAPSVLHHGTPDENATALDYQTMNWTVNLPELRRQIETGSAIQAPLGGSGWQWLALNPREIYAPGEKKVQIGDANGTVVAEIPLDLGTYGGSVMGDAYSIASLTVNNVGVYGFAYFLGTYYDFIPTSDKPANDPTNAIVRVQWANGTLDLGPLGTAFGNLTMPVGGLLGSEQAAASYKTGADTASSACKSTTTKNPPARTSGPGVQAGGSSCPSGGGSSGGGGSGGGGGGGGGDPEPGASECHGPKSSGYSGWNAMCVKPVADQKYWGTFSDYAARITAALNNQVSMWQSPVILFQARSIYAHGSNYSDSQICQTHWEAFNSGRPSDSLAAGFQLFTGTELQDCTGAASPYSQDCRIAPYPATIIRGVDKIHHYDADNSRQVALISGHELGHIWGEYDHVMTKNSDGYYSIMASEVTITEIALYFAAATSQPQIRDAARYGHCA